MSRAVSHALRHEPWLYELELDEQGWVPVDSLVSALRQGRWSSLTAADIEAMVAGASKQRHEIVDGRIRAFYATNDKVWLADVVSPESIGSDPL